MFSDLEQLLFNNSQVVDYLNKEVQQEIEQEQELIKINPEDFKKMLGEHYDLNAKILEEFFRPDAFRDLTPYQINEILGGVFKKLFPIQNTQKEALNEKAQREIYKAFLDQLNGI